MYVLVLEEVWRDGAGGHDPVGVGHCLEHEWRPRVRVMDLQDGGVVAASEDKFR